MDLTPATWRVLGLSVAISYMGLGTFALTAPVLAAKGFGLYPSTASRSTAEAPKSVATTATTTTRLTTEDSKETHAAAVTTSMLLLGARDLSIGVALATFWSRDDRRAMGTLILSGMVLCVVDVWEIGRLRGPSWGGAFGVGAAIWMVIGYGLVQEA